MSEEPEILIPALVTSSEVSPGKIKLRLILGPALIDLEATVEEIVKVVTRLTQEFTKAAIIPAK